MTTKRPQLYPQHQHRWTDEDTRLFHTHTVRCTICGFEVPRNLAKVDGTPASQTPVDDSGVCT